MKMNNIFFMVVLFFLLSCTKKERNTDVPLYHFSPSIKFVGYSNEALDSSKVIFIKKEKQLIGKINFIEQNDTISFARIKFESIYDTIKKTDTIKLFINKEVHHFYKIKQTFVDINGIRPAFIVFFLDNKKSNEEESILYKQ